MIWLIIKTAILQLVPPVIRSTIRPNRSHLLSHAISYPLSHPALTSSQPYNQPFIHLSTQQSNRDPTILSAIHIASQVFIHSAIHLALQSANSQIKLICLLSHEERLPVSPVVGHSVSPQVIHPITHTISHPSKQPSSHSLTYNSYFCSQLSGHPPNIHVVEAEIILCLFECPRAPENQQASIDYLLLCSARASCCKRCFMNVPGGRVMR